MQHAAVLSILLRANTGAATTGLIRFNQQLDNTEKHSHKAARAIETVAKAGALIGGAAVVGGMAYAVKKAADFEQQMSSLGAVADASGKQMDRFRKQAIRAGAQTKFSALDAAKAQTELAKGGLSVSQIMKGGLRSSLALAAAGEMDLADAATATVNAIKLFGLRGKEAMKVADGFATAANSTTADVSDFAIALRQGGSASKAAGLGFRDTIVYLESLAEAGIKGSDAGTSMKTALLQLATPTIKASGVMDDLGLKFFDAHGEMKGVVEISKMLRTQMGGLTREQRLQAITTIVGTDGMRGLLALYDAGPKKLQKLRDELNKQGTAAEVAKKKQDNLKGSLEQLSGSIETLGIQVGTALIPVIRTAADELTGLANGIGRIIARKDLTLGEKLQRSLDLAKVRLDPWVDKLKDAIDKADIPKKLADLISAATPVIVKAAAAGGLAAAKTFVGAFAQSDMWGKLVLGGWLFSRMGGKGAFFKMGAKAGGAFGAGMQTGMPAARGASDPANRGAPLAVAAAAGGLASKAKGLLKTGGKLAGKFAALDLAINLVDSKGNLLAAGVNTAHDLTFGIVPKIKVKTGEEKTGEQFVKLSKSLDAVTKKRDTSQLDGMAGKFRKMADEARAFHNGPVAKEYDKLADKATKSIQRIQDQERNAKGASGRFADAIRGLRLSGSKDFDKLVSSVTTGSRNILRIGGGNTKQTQQEISHQFAIARTRVKESMDAQVISVRQGSRLLHTLAVKELGLYGIKAGRVNVVLAKGANGQMRPNARGGFQHSGEGTGDSIPSMLERGEYVVNRKAVQKVGKNRLDALNFGMAPRFQQGGMAGGGSVTGDTDFVPALMSALQRLSAAAHTPIFVQSGRRTVAEQLAQGPSTPGHPVAGPNGPHVQGIAADITPGFGTFGRLAAKFGLGFTVMPQEPWHIQLLDAAAAMMPAFAGLKRPVLQGPASVALEAGQGALDRIRSAANASVEAAYNASFANGSETGMAGLSGGTSSANQALGLKMMLAHGWGQDQWPALKALWTRESGWSTTARNPKSGAFGIPQALGHGFIGNSAAEQIAWGLNYISGRYGSPSAAWAHEQSAGWYQKGGLAGMKKGGFARDPFAGTLGNLPSVSKGRPGKSDLNLHKLFDAVRTGSKKLRRSSVRHVLDVVKSIDLPRSVKSRLSDLGDKSQIYGDYADRAGQLTDTDAITAALQAEFDRRATAGQGFPDAEQAKMAQSLMAKVNGATQGEWLKKQLDVLFKWRNKLIEAAALALKKRAKVVKLEEKVRTRLAKVRTAIADAHEKRRGLEAQLRTAEKDPNKSLAKQLEEAKKHPKKNKALIEQLNARIHGNAKAQKVTTRDLKGRIAAIDKAQKKRTRLRDTLIDPVLKGMNAQEAKLTTAHNTFLGSEGLEGVQGVGSPMKVLRKLPPVGVLGGTIFDVQQQLKGIVGADVRITDTSTGTSSSDTGADTSSDLSSALSELLTQANQRNAVLSAQYKVFQDFPGIPYGGAFATGGVVPGGVGEPRMAVVHGGEGVFTPDQMAAIGGSAAPIVHVHVDPAMAFLQKFIRVEVEGGTRRQARSASRALPGRPGSLR